MPNGKKADTTGEHLMALYGHVEGLKKDVRHVHKDIDVLHTKIGEIERKTDNLLYYIIGGAFATILTLTGLFNLFRY